MILWLMHMAQVNILIYASQNQRFMLQFSHFFLNITSKVPGIFISCPTHFDAFMAQSYSKVCGILNQVQHCFPQILRADIALFFFWGFSASHPFVNLLSYLVTGQPTSGLGLITRGTRQAVWASRLAFPTRLRRTRMNLDPSRSSPRREETPFSQQFLFSVAPVFKSRAHIVVSTSSLSSRQARSENWLLQGTARLPKAHSHLT